VLDRIVGLVAVVPFAIGSLAGVPAPHAVVEFSYRDPAIVESSALVVVDDLFVTVNDSGDSGRVFVVDRSGATVGVTSWDGDPVDDEALAPAGSGSVWVGDIGDNSGSRESVEVLEVPVGRSNEHVVPERYELVYPGGGRDAETLMANPRTGQLFVVSKNLFGGTIYAAPRRLSTAHPNRLRPVADSLGLATDGAFFPDGRHYVVRDYATATVYTFPGHEQVGSFSLPKQRQGEGIAVDADGAVFVGTEGQFSDVLRVDLPRSVARGMAPPPPSPDAYASHLDIDVDDEDDHPPLWPWLLGGGAVFVGFAAGIARLLTRHGSAS
jgi:hypothetical protein